MNELETRATAQLNNDLAEVSTNVSAKSEIARRHKVLEQYNLENPGNQITQQVVSNDVPPRITNKLSEGEITFEEFLSEVNTYLSTPKVIQNETINRQADLGKIGGASHADPHAVAQDSIGSYESEIY